VTSPLELPEDDHSVILDLWLHCFKKEESEVWKKLLRDSAKDTQKKELLNLILGRVEGNVDKGEVEDGGKTEQKNIEEDDLEFLSTLPSLMHPDSFEQSTSLFKMSPDHYTE
jgi:hypothetical protein